MQVKRHKRDSPSPSAIALAVIAYQYILVAAAGERQRVLLLSFDGFRWDYLNDKFTTKYHLSLPNFDKLKVSDFNAVNYYLKKNDSQLLLKT